METDESWLNLNQISKLSYFALCLVSRCADDALTYVIDHERENLESSDGRELVRAYRLAFRLAEEMFVRMEDGTVTDIRLDVHARYIEVLRKEKLEPVESMALRSVLWAAQQRWGTRLIVPGQSEEPKRAA